MMKSLRIAIIDAKDRAMISVSRAFIHGAVWGALFVGSAQATPPARVQAAFGQPVPTEPLPEPRNLASPQKAWTLDDLLNLAAEHNPDVAAARARVTAARGKLVQAGLYPNPQLSWVGNQMLNKANAGGEQGPLLVQQFVTADKLRLAENAARHGIAAADWQVTTRWYDVVTRVRLAYFEALTAGAEVRVSEEIVRIAEQGLDVAQRLEKGGAGTRPDVLRARVDLNQSVQRLGVARRRLDAAWQLLAVAVGMRELPSAPLAGTLEGPSPTYDWQPVLNAMLVRSSELREAWANVHQADELLRRARADRIPNVQLGVRPFYSFPDQDKRLFVDLGMQLPIFNRNQGNILSAEGDVVRTREEVRQVELKLIERLALAYRRYQAAREQVTSFERDILPDAAESLRLVRLGYERGDAKYDYTTVLQAQQTLAQARLAYVQALGELWRAASDIAGLLQHDRIEMP
jgi:cobalt-zinc-cadmium efflux system outer membrane protein